MITTKEAFLRELRDLGLGLKAPIHNDFGVCLHMTEQTDFTKIGTHFFAEFKNKMAEWPEGTGDRTYPVPGLPFIKNTKVAATMFGLPGMWSGLYGRRRRALALWLSENL